MNPTRRATAHVISALWVAFLTVLAPMATAPGDVLAQPSADQVWSEVLLSQVRCADPSTCPPYAGAVVTQSVEPNTTMCAFTLVAPDVALTAAHCLPPEMRREGASCATTRFFFPATDIHPAQQAGCARVLQVSSVGPPHVDILREDIAVLRLDRSIPRRPAQLTNRGLNDHERVTINYPVDVSTNREAHTYDFIIHSMSCDAVHDSVYAPGVDGPSAIVQTLGACATRPGSSGAGIVNSVGDVAAVLEGSFYYMGDQAERLASFRSDYMNHLSLQEQEMIAVDPPQRAATGTNLACTGIPAIGFERSGYAYITCAPNHMLYRDRQALTHDRQAFLTRFAARVAAARQTIEGEVALYVSGLPEDVVWHIDVEAQAGRLQLRVAPECRHPGGPTRRHVMVPAMAVDARVRADSRTEIAIERTERRVSVSHLRRCR